MFILQLFKQMISVYKAHCGKIVSIPVRTTIAESKEIQTLSFFFIFYPK